jgi:hypothetical protein
MWGSRNAGATVVVVKPSKFDWSTSWAVFYQQFEAMAVQNGWEAYTSIRHSLAATEQLDPPGCCRFARELHPERRSLCVDGVEGRDVKQHLLTGGERSFNESLNQALKLEAAKAAAGLSAKLGKVSLDDPYTDGGGVSQLKEVMRDVKRGPTTC